MFTPPVLTSTSLTALNPNPRTQVLGAAELVKSVMLCNQWVQFSVSTPAQVAIAGALTTAAQPYSEPGVRRMAHDTYFSFINTMYQVPPHAIITPT